MYSYKKELQQDDADYNIITVIREHLGVGIDGGLDWLLNRHDEAVQDFITVADNVRNQHGFPSLGERMNKQVSDYIDGLALWVRGNDAWSFENQRYFGNEGLEVQIHRTVVIKSWSFSIGWLRLFKVLSDFKFVFRSYF